MARVKRGVIARARHKKIMKQAKGYYGARSRVYRVAFQAVIKAGQYAYRDRRQRKRQFRQLWIARINAAARQNGLSYSKFINGLKKRRSKLTVRSWLTSQSSTKWPSAHWLRKRKQLWRKSVEEELAPSFNLCFQRQILTFIGRRYITGGQSSTRYRNHARSYFSFLFTLAPDFRRLCA